MNTPKPCNNCTNCGWDCMSEDDPSTNAWCKLNLVMGKNTCPMFMPHYDVMGINKLISDAAEASEIFDADELEQYARELKK